MQNRISFLCQARILRLCPEDVNIWAHLCLPHGGWSVGRLAEKLRWSCTEEPRALPSSCARTPSLPCLKAWFVALYLKRYNPASFRLRAPSSFCLERCNLASSLSNEEHHLVLNTIVSGTLHYARLHSYNNIMATFLKIPLWLLSSETFRAFSCKRKVQTITNCGNEWNSLRVNGALVPHTILQKFMLLHIFVVGQNTNKFLHTKSLN